MSKATFGDCVSCGHPWRVHARPGGVEDADVNQGQFWCYQDDCRCRHYRDPGMELAERPTRGFTPPDEGKAIGSATQCLSCVALTSSLTILQGALENMIREMRMIAIVAGQWSVENADDEAHSMAAEEARRASRWADTLSAAEASNEMRRLRQRIDWLEGTAIPHARKQENANGFQKGWHAALSRVTEGDTADDLSKLVPFPAADVDNTLPLESAERPTRGFTPVDEGKETGSASQCLSCVALTSSLTILQGALSQLIAKWQKEIDGGDPMEPHIIAIEERIEDLSAALTASLRQDKEHDLTRQSSSVPSTATGSPRSQPKGSER